MGVVRGRSFGLTTFWVKAPGLYCHCSNWEGNRPNSALDSKTYGSLLSPVLLSTLPDELCLLVSRDISEDDWSLDTPLEWVEREVVESERAGGSRMRSEEGNMATTGSTLLIPSTPTCCHYQQQVHSSNSCKSVLYVEEWKRIWRSGWWYVCLRKGHVSRNCRSTCRCYWCKGKHHSGICSSESPKDVANGTSKKSL